MRIRCSARIALAVAAAGLAAAPEVARAQLNVLGPPLTPAVPRVHDLAPRPSQTPLRLGDGLAGWRGDAARIAGSSHYDRGEWIYEDHVWESYGAAPPGLASVYETLDGLAAALPVTARLPTLTSFVIPSAGAGPMVPEADLSELRVAVRGTDLHVLARTTTMRSPVRTALLLLFDTGRAGLARAVPFGSGLTTRAADTAVLVTADGARVADLADGGVTQAPAAAEPAGYANALQTRLPLARVAAGDELRMVAAAGLTAGGFTLHPGDAAGPLANVAPRPREPIARVYERQQALALARHDIDRFRTTIDLDRLRRGDRERLTPGRGYSMLTLEVPEEIASENGEVGALQTYGLHVPTGFSPRRATPATMFLPGSGISASQHAALQPWLLRQLGDENGALVITPGTHTMTSLFAGTAYRYLEEVLADAQARLPIDEGRLTIGGYSQGGYGTFLLAGTQPDRFAAGYAIAAPISAANQGPVAQPVPDLHPALRNLQHVPVAVHQGTADINVPIFNGLDVARTLRGLGYRYRLDIYQGDHYVPGISDDYTVGARLLRTARIEPRPAEVRFARDMAFERRIDRGDLSSDPARGRGVGLRFDRAWYVSGLTATDPVDGVAAVHVRTFARPLEAVTPVHTSGVDPGHNGALPTLFEELRWEMVQSREPLRNALHASLSGTADITLDIRRMALTVARPLTATIDTDAATVVRLRLPRRACTSVSVDGSRRPRGRARSVVGLPLAPGSHEIAVRQARGCR